MSSRRLPAVVGATVVALGLGAAAVQTRGGEPEAAAADRGMPARAADGTRQRVEPVAVALPTTPAIAYPAAVPSATTAPGAGDGDERAAPAPPTEGAGALAAADGDDRLAKPAFDATGRRLPQGSEWALPPMIRLRAAAVDASVSADRLAAAVLASRRFGLAAAARRNVERGRVSPAALALLLRLRGNGPPLIVHAARGGELSIQETSLVATQRTIARLDRLPAGAAPASLRLRSVQAGLADEGAGRVDAGSPGSIGKAAADLALQHLGVPYVWGGATPEQGLDCSGLVQYVYGQLGIPLTHYAAFQFREGDPVPSSALRAGDLVFFNPKADGPGHVGIYIGDGLMVHAPRTGDVVRVADLASRAGSYMGAVRPYSL